ncbi:D-lactate dehydrogenase [Aliiroseovarius sp. KMU-50]|uniref:Quinone-dependent D-lactate dehydrogenase n=1 Tax=Aliiroseovarius salicola TaxID=3009082 RepID=A0ABT4W3N9_9RHOB|nr:D-lactate dehydrogenase [Aliiroseovarius sp. KMU-50]MDA5095124.1 D-lactate dehydrogenase [Aliiroseovarius sp. KMU-50]
MSDQDLIQKLQKICGRRHVMTGARRTARFRKGFRSGEGDALAVVQPGTLLEQWKILQACVAADKIVIMQAANTGLTEGSTPKGSYDRDVVLINTRRMDGLQLIKDGKQVISFPGSTLFALEKLLAPLKRQPHSVIGSSCIGASVVGGVCNNSGGSLVERGPSYTELSLYARITEDGQLELVNHLGIALGNTPEEILTRLERGEYSPDDLESSNRKASDTDYARRVRNVDADTPARFNADMSRLYEAAGCAGKLAVFAVRLDTYPMNDAERTFYIGTRDTAALTELRRRILADFDTLPVSAEYMHEEVFDLSDRYGKDTMVMIDKLGTDRLPMFFAMKGAVDARLSNVPGMANFTDRFMQALARIWPDILPKRMRSFRAKHPHHLILKMRDGGIAEAQVLLAEMASTAQLEFFECNPREAKMAGLHRFAAAGAAVRYMNVHRAEVEEIIALDIALRRNDREWFEELPPEISGQLVSSLYYGHFMCHVLHQDYIVKKGADPKALKEAMLKILDARGAEYPAEHNVGHLYAAKPDLAAFYKSVDPTNSMNPGIGKMSRKKNYA